MLDWVMNNVDYCLYLTSYYLYFLQFMISKIIYLRSLSNHCTYMKDTDKYLLISFDL